MTYNLLLIQQCANRRLEELEDEAASDAVSGNIMDLGPNYMLPPPIVEPRSPQTSKTYTVKRKSIGTSNVATEKALPSLASVNVKRTSVLINQRVFEVNGDSTASNWTPTKGINLHQAAVHSDALLQKWTDRAHPKSPTAPEHADQTILESSQSEPDRASYISWDSEPVSFDMANAELVKAKGLLQEAVKEQQMLKEEARRAWEELGRREAEERQRAINLRRQREELSLRGGEEEEQRAISLRSGVRTFVGGVEVVPAGSVKDPIINNVDIDTKLLSSDEITRRTDWDQQPGDKSMWVWDNTREEILKVEGQVRGELPTHDYASSSPSATRAPESFQRQIDQHMSQDLNDLHIKVPKIHQTTSPRTRTEMFPEKRSTSDGSGSAKQRSTSSAMQTPVMASETQNVQRSGSTFPHAFERWETLSSHWEGLTSFWVGRLEENRDQLKEKPFMEQMGRQITDLSAAGANLFHALVELQRLRASSERKFQRWFFETRQEQERAREAQGELERLLGAERDERAHALACIATAERDRIKAEDLVGEMRRNQLRLESGVSRESNLHGGLLWQPPQRLSTVEKPD